MNPRSTSVAAAGYRKPAVRYSLLATRYSLTEAELRT